MAGSGGVTKTISKIPGSLAENTKIGHRIILRKKFTYHGKIQDGVNKQN